MHSVKLYTIFFPHSVFCPLISKSVCYYGCSLTLSRHLQCFIGVGSEMFFWCSFVGNL